MRTSDAPNTSTCNALARRVTRAASKVRPVFDPARWPSSRCSPKASSWRPSAQRPPAPWRRRRRQTPCAGRTAPRNGAAVGPTVLLADARVLHVGLKRRALRLAVTVAFKRTRLSAVAVVAPVDEAAVLEAFDALAELAAHAQPRGQHARSRDWETAACAGALCGGGRCCAARRVLAARLRRGWRRRGAAAAARTMRTCRTRSATSTRRCALERHADDERATCDGYRLITLERRRSRVASSEASGPLPSGDRARPFRRARDGQRCADVVARVTLRFAESRRSVDDLRWRSHDRHSCRMSHRDRRIVGRSLRSARRRSARRAERWRIAAVSRVAAVCCRRVSWRQCLLVQKCRIVS